ncbi:MAG TPA: DinB family protein [Tepidisphaeraceae bacterium]|nr:DinB family protein [Tepidisphaeraceae bacterium]
MIDPKTVELLWRYMVHADAQVLEAAQSVPDEGYFREQGISLGSIHKLLVHCMDAQHNWLNRLNGLENPPLLEASQISRGMLAGRWAALHQELLAFAAAQSPQSLERTFRFRTRKGDPMQITVGACMLHVCDHATYHRGQLNSMIKLGGGVPSPVMVYTWSIEQGMGKKGWE